MPSKKSPVYFRHDEPVNKKSKKPRVFAILSILLLLGGGYLLLLTQSPLLDNFPIGSSIDLNKSDDANDNRNRVQIEKLNIEVPYYADKTPASLEKGAWWRFPDRGDPTKGGNFILSAHRFNLGFTPQGTRAKSPFYNLGKLSEGDKIRIYYEGKWYDYEVTKNYSVDRNAIQIENETVEPRLTLYTCSLKGEADGRVVIDAIPQFENLSQKPPDEGSPLL